MWLPSQVIINGKALRNITDGNPLHQNDNQCSHQVIILVKVVNDAAAPWHAHDNNMGAN